MLFGLAAGALLFVLSWGFSCVVGVWFWWVFVLVWCVGFLWVLLGGLWGGFVWGFVWGFVLGLQLGLGLGFRLGLPKSTGTSPSTSLPAMLTLTLTARRDMQPADSNGLADPYVKVICCGVEPMTLT